MEIKPATVRGNTRDLYQTAQVMTYRKQNKTVTIKKKQSWSTYRQERERNFINGQNIEWILLWEGLINPVVEPDEMFDESIFDEYSEIDIDTCNIKYWGYRSYEKDQMWWNSNRFEQSR